MSPRQRTAGLVAVGDEELAARAQAGHTLAEQVLLERHRRIASAKRRAYFLVGGDGEDLEQEALIGLHKAIRDFRPEAATTFRSFAEVCITRQIATAIKCATRQKHQALNRYVSLSGGVGGDHTGATVLDELLDRHHLPDPGDQVVDAEGASALRSAMAALLSPLEADALELHLQGWSYQEAAEHLGRGVKSIDNALRRAKRKVEAHLSTGGAGGRTSLAC